MHLVQSMYKDVRYRVRVGDGYKEEVAVGVCANQGSVQQLLYADDLTISVESMEELLLKLKT